MKKLLVVCLIIAVCVFYHDILYNKFYAQPLNIKACTEHSIANGQGNYLENADHGGYCACINTNEITQRGTRVEATEQVVGPCFRQYLKPHIVTSCKSNDAETKATGWSLNCDCFAEEATKAFIEARKTTSAKLTNEFGNKMARKSFLTCAKRL